MTTATTAPLSQTTLAELAELAGRYPQARSALLPMLHLVQSAQNCITPEGIEACARLLGLSAAEVSGVATFYTMYKRRPMGDYHVGVCTNTLCAVMGGDEIIERLKDHLDVGNDETTEDGKVTLEHIECNAACDYAPVVMVNWEFFDNQTPSRPCSSSTTCGPAPRSGRPAVRACAPGARPSGCSPGSPTTAPTRAPARGRPRSSGWRSRASAAGAPRRRTAPALRLTRRLPVRLRGRGRSGRAGRHHARGVRDPGRRGVRTWHRGHPEGGRQVTDVLTPVLTEHWDDERSWTLRSYERSGGYASVDKALGMSPDDVVSLVKDSGLRGRGGAGFSTGMKWGFIPKAKEGEVAKPHYLVVNADESEPGTCKDIPLMMASPHTLVEGVIVSSYAIRANVAFIYVRGEVLHVVRRLQRAVQEAYLAGHLGKDIHGSGYDLDLIVHAGAGAYICGEETALLDSLEGRRGQPRLRPPFPAVAGLYASPTVINNVESIASVPCILTEGASWFASMGTEKSKGMTIYSLSGHVQRPGQYEAPLGITLRELLELGGGVRAGHQLKFWTPAARPRRS
jgi:NADH-quinone oxidoreductase subunit F